MEIIKMKFIKKVILLSGAIGLMLGMAFGQQTTYVQSLGPLTSTAGCTASTGTNTSVSISPCGGQGGMFQNSLVLSHTLTWTSVATVSTCTIQLEQSTTGTGTWTLLGASQTCTSTDRK